MHCQLGEHQAQYEGHPTDQFVQRRLVFQMYHGNSDDSKLPQLTATVGGIGGKWKISYPACVFTRICYLYGISMPILTCCPSLRQH